MANDTGRRATATRAILGKISAGTPKNISGATNATPIVITATAHGLLTGDKALVAAVGGNTAANGLFSVTRVDANTLSLNGSVGNGSYTSGGTATRLYCSLTADDTRTLADGLNRLRQATTDVVDDVVLPYVLTA
jgi:hypothetical protein